MTAIYQKPLHIILYKEVKLTIDFLMKIPQTNTPMAHFDTLITKSFTLIGQIDTVLPQ